MGIVDQNDKKKLHSLREEYGNAPLLEDEAADNPFDQFTLWFEEAMKASVFEPNGMVVATSSLDAKPSTRTVLLKEYGTSGFVFFTGTKSRKADQLLANPFASATFWWKEVHRQVHIEGKVTKVSEEEVASYFQKRPLGAQLAAHASVQSQPLENRDELDEAYAEAEKKFHHQIIPLPLHWGGYRLFPERVEFWQGRRNRLHDRLIYILVEGSWVLVRLSP